MTDDGRRTAETMTGTTHGTTAEREPTERETAYRPTLGEVSHTNPYTGAVFGATQTYGRGRTVAADGGEADALAEDPDEETAADDAETTGTDEETLADVDHTPAGEVDGAQAAYDRGEETTSEPDDE